MPRRKSPVPRDLKFIEETHTIVDPDTGEVLKQETIYSGVKTADNRPFRKFYPSSDYYLLSRPAMLVYFYVMNHLPRGKSEIRMTPGVVMAETGIGTRQQFHTGVKFLVDMGFLSTLGQSHWHVNRRYVIHGK